MGRTEPASTPPPVSKPAGRNHQVGLKALQPNTSYRLIELNTGEDRASGLLQPRDPELRVMVRGPFTLESNAVENLSVRIDNFPYKLPETVFGTARAEFPDASTVPPPPPVKPAPTKRGR